MLSELTTLFGSSPALRMWSTPAHTGDYENRTTEVSRQGPGGRWPGHVARHRPIELSGGQPMQRVAIGPGAGVRPIAGAMATSLRQSG